MKNIRKRHIPKKIRKARGTKLNGRKSMDMCEGCIAFNCDPMAMSTEFHFKTIRRKVQGLCPACGHNPCTCKSVLIKQGMSLYHPDLAMNRKDWNRCLRFLKRQGYSHMDWMKDPRLHIKLGFI